MPPQARAVLVGVELGHARRDHRLDAPPQVGDQLVQLHARVAMLVHPAAVGGEGDLLGPRRVYVLRHAQKLADHVEEADLVGEDRLLVVGAHRRDDLLEAVEVTGDRSGQETGTSRPMPARSLRTSSIAFWYSAFTIRLVFMS